MSNLVVGQDATSQSAASSGQQSGTMDVVEGIPNVNITTSPISGLVTEQQVKDLPLNGRSLDNLIATNPRRAQLQRL